jgi:hypothetical protein
VKTRPAILAAGTAALLLTFFATRRAAALGPIDLEVAPKVGYATATVGGLPGDPIPLGLGIGGRGGVSFRGLYGGVNFQYYVGGSEWVGSSNVSFHAVQFGGEVGWGINIRFLTIRPLLGLGDLASSAGGAGGASGSFYLEPGGLIQLAFGHLIFGVDAACLILTNGENSEGARGVDEGFTIHGQVGARF